MKIQENRLYVNRLLNIYLVNIEDNILKTYPVIASSIGANRKKQYACAKNGYYKVFTKNSKSNLVEEIDTFDNNSKAITNLFEIVNFHSRERKNISIYSNASKYKIDKEFFFEDNGEIKNSETERCLFFKIEHKKIVAIHKKKDNLRIRLYYDLD